MPVKADESAKEPDEGGIFYLLFDRQDNVGLQSSFYHEARRVTSENGVQNGASVTATFDPSYQKLTFHTLHIIRNGKRLNRLDRGAIKLLQRERDMESFLYDGAYTAQCELEDVRVGDVVEYSFTVDGRNPVKGGLYSRVFYTDWNKKVHRVITRLLYPTGRVIHFQTRNRPLKPSVTTEKTTTIWLCDQENVPARRTDPDAPADYDANGFIQFSEFGSWKAVADWALPLFQSPEPLSAEIQGEIEKLRAINDVEKRILAALRLVQDEVRYLGIESGVGSHRPTSPSEVLRRRFGDCKDKALLLSTLLQQSGVDAVPALVSTSYRKTVADQLPSADDFDHAIVQVKNGEQTHWLDPTRSRQRGRLTEIYVRDLGFALLVRPGTEALTAYSPPAQSLPRKKVTEKYRVPAPGGTGEFEVVTECYGLSAERTRSSFQESGPENLAKDYLKYYARTFPKVTTRKPLVFEELPETNGCRVTESYSIPEIWEWDAEEKNYRLILYPGDVAQAMGSPGSSQRDDPLALNYPANVTQEIEAEMFDRWTLDVKNHSVKNKFFQFTDTTTVKGRRLHFIYTYEALADRVLPADLAAYNTALSKVRDTLGYSLTYRPTAEMVEWRRWLQQINWAYGILGVLVVTGAMLVCAVFIYKTKREMPLPPPELTLPHLEGLRGWLFLVGIHHFLLPTGFFIALCIVFQSVLNGDSWRVLTEPGHAEFHPLWKAKLLFEYVADLICLAVSLMLLVLFLGKRAVWPRTYALFLAFIVAATAIDTYLSQKIPAAEALDSGKTLVQTIGAAVVWIPYCLISKRVKATFRR